VVLAEDLPKDFSWRWEGPKRWSQHQWDVAVRTALRFLEARYSDAVHQRAVAFIHAGEVDKGFPRFRSWLSKRTQRLDPARSEWDEMHLAEFKMIARCAGRYPATYLPECFDLYTKWVRLSNGGPRLRIGAVVVGKPALDWQLADEAAMEMARVFRDAIPKSERWLKAFASDNPSGRQAEWRRELPAWLEKHPEARSYWVQRYYRHLRGSHDKLALRNGERAVLLKKAIKAYEAEFAEELADRRGICAEQHR